MADTLARVAITSSTPVRVGAGGFEFRMMTRFIDPLDDEAYTALRGQLREYEQRARTSGAVYETGRILTSAGAWDVMITGGAIDADHGGTLEVYGQVDGKPVELLKFDCFTNGPHWHRCYPGRADEITQLAPANADSALQFAIETLRTRFGALIEAQGFGTLRDATGEPAVTAALARTETAMLALIHRDRPAVTGAERAGAEGA